MTKQEYLEILSQGVDNWNLWRDKNIRPNIDLSNIDFQGKDLEEINFDNVNLDNSNFKNARLSDASFCYASLRGVTFDEADLEGANLENAVFEKNSFVSSELTNSLFGSANLKYADFSRSNLDCVYFEEADLDGCIFESCKLNGAVFVQSNLNKVNFNNAELVDANFTAANLHGAQLKSADLERANFFLAQVTFANLFNAILQSALVTDTNFDNSTLTGICIEDWNINSDTSFRDVICDYVFLTLATRERRPSDPERNFLKGEFALLVQKNINTVDLIFSEGINWRAFLNSFQNISLDKKFGQLNINAIEQKDNGAFIIRVNIPAKELQEEIEKTFYSRYSSELKILEDTYRRELKAKDTEIEIYKKQSASFEEITKLLASRPINVEARAISQGDITQSGNFGIGNMSGGTIEDNARVFGSNGDSQDNRQAKIVAEYIDALIQDFEKGGKTKQMILVPQLIQEIDKNNELKKLLKSLKLEYIAAIEQFLNHQASSFIVASLKAWYEDQEYP